MPPGPSSPWRRPSQIKPNLNKRTLINDLISVPHHTADDKFGDGRPGGTTCGFPPLFGAVRRGGGASKPSRAVIRAQPRSCQR